MKEKKTKYGKGINDMKRGWIKENEINYRIYACWSNMLKRCYSEKWHEKYPTYKDCYVCERWLKLSNFVNDISNIDGYLLWVDNPNKYICLDKDIKSNGNNKCYCLEECMFVTNEDNIRQCVKTRDNSYMKNKDKYVNIVKKVECYDKNNNLIKTYENIREAEKETGINNGNITACCKFWEINCDKNKWFEKRKDNPRKTAGGYIWKYKEMGDDNE